jgi:hypothetical protein
MVKVNGNDVVLVFYDTLVYINLVATKKRNLETMKVNLPDLLYLTIIHVFVCAHNIISINTYTQTKRREENERRRMSNLARSPCFTLPRSCALKRGGGQNGDTLN